MGVKAVGKKIGKYFWRILVGVDQLGNTLLGGAPDETISARAARNRDKNPLAGALCSVLDGIERDHCEKAVLSERLGKQQAEAYEDVYDPDDVVLTLYADGTSEVKESAE